MAVNEFPKLKSGYVVKKVDFYKTLYYWLVIIAEDERFVIQWYYFDKDGELCQYITTDQEFKDVTEVWSGAWNDISCWLTYNIKDYITTHLPGKLLWSRPKEIIELTLQEIVNKFGVEVSSLKIKE